VHLHGLAYAVVGIGKLKTSIKLAEVEALDKAGKLPRNFDNPPVKDTVTVPVGGYTIIRFVADNPGTWMFHCHLDFHSEIGMGLLIKIGNQRDLPRPPMNWPQCGNYDYTPDKTYSIFNNWPFWKNN
jgi:L-ascorbate oxidase